METIWALVISGKEGGVADTGCYGIGKLIHIHSVHNSALAVGHNEPSREIQLGSNGNQTHEQKHHDCNRLASIWPAMTPSFPQNFGKITSPKDALSTYRMETICALVIWNMIIMRDGTVTQMLQVSYCFLGLGWHFLRNWVNMTSMCIKR